MRGIALPEGWYLLFDVVWDDITPVCAAIVKLWRDWGCAPSDSRQAVEDLAIGGFKTEEEDEEEERARQDRWRRAWVLAESRKAVRKWVEESRARAR